MVARKGLGRGKGKGYKNIAGKDPRVHSDSAKGRKQPQEVNPCLTKPTPKQKLPDQAEFYDSLWVNNKGVFYRGTANGKGLGFGVLGEGTYVTWSKGMATVFARISADQHDGTPRVEEIKLSRDLKLLDAQSKTFIDIKKRLGVDPFEKVADPLFASLLTNEIKEKGFDGVISDDKAEGIVIFEK